MKIEKKENYTLITPTEATLDTFLDVLNISAFEKENTILDFSTTFQLTVAQIDAFSEVSIAKKEKGTSFILIAKGIEIDDLEDESLAVVPTITEAEDTLEMDDIERDLGL
jgi:hypothetical protein